MGIPNKPYNVRMDDETVRKVDEGVDIMWPMCPNRSAYLRWLAGIGHTILTMPSILQAVDKAFQDASCALFVRRAHNQEFVADSEQLRKPGPCTAQKGVSRPRLISHQFTASGECRLHLQTGPRGFAQRITPFGLLATPSTSLARGSYSVRERVA